MLNMSSKFLTLKFIDRIKVELSFWCFRFDERTNEIRLRVHNQIIIKKSKVSLSFLFFIQLLFRGYDRNRWFFDRDEDNKRTFRN